MSHDPPRARLRTLRRVLAALAVVAATVAGAIGVVATYREDASLSVGNIRMAAAPGHQGALDVYVPLVDWGARFPAVRVPVRLRVEVRTIDRAQAKRVAEGATVDVREVRAEARSAIASYLRELIALAVAGGLALGLLVAFAVRGAHVVRLRWLVGSAVATAAAVGVALVVLLPPRGEIADPQYYANGPDIPRALEAIDRARRSARALDEELDQQLVGLAQLVVAPAERPRLTGRPHLLLASDLHNNVLAIPTLANLAGDAPVFFAGDLTDRGTPLESRLVRRVVEAGSEFVFVSGNHDSDSLMRELERDGAIVLGRPGAEHEIVEVAGLRVAGYGDPFIRRSSEGYRDRYQPEPTPEQQNDFKLWFDGLRGRIDVAMVHQPALAEPVLAELRENPPERPFVLLTGHTHRPAIERIGAMTVLNGGSIGAGGAANLGEGTRLGVARLLYLGGARFEPLAADLIEVDPGSGSASADRVRLDTPPHDEG